jgi:hypothetical protein
MAEHSKTQHQRVHPDLLRLWQAWTSPSSAPTRRLQLRLPKHRPQEEDLLSLLLSNLRAVGSLPI